MNNSIIYRPLTATPFKRNSFYTEISPSKELQSYIRCYWGTEKTLIQIENSDAPELVIPDTCVDIIYHIDYTDNTVTGGLCGVNDCSFHAHGKTIEETAKLVQHPIEVVRGWYDQYQKELISVCGTDCSACYCFGKMCNGCNSCKGKVFHAPEGKACPIYDCVRNNKCMQNCGECGEIPCKLWFDTREPKFSDEEFKENIAMRVQTLKKE